MVDTTDGGTDAPTFDGMDRQSAATTPRGIDAADRRALDRARSVARLLDDAIRVPGTRFRIGLDPILGIAPVSGDAVAALGALYIVFTGVKLGVPLRVTLTMLANVLVDFAVGSIPVLGTVIDAKLKVNRRNVALLEASLGESEAADYS